MKVFLRENVEKVGKAGEMVDVAEGYAFNCLIPRKLAYLATGDNELRVHAEAKRRSVHELERVASLKELATLLAGRSVTISARANEEQKLFGSVDAAMVAAALKAEHGANVEPSHVALEQPIRELGVFDVKLRFAEGIQSDVKVWVVQQD
jgi:large subunit ribosomal protein L9